MRISTSHSPGRNFSFLRLRSYVARISVLEDFGGPRSMSQASHRSMTRRKPARLRGRSKRHIPGPTNDCCACNSSPEPPKNAKTNAACTVIELAPEHAEQLFGSSSTSTSPDLWLQLNRSDDRSIPAKLHLSMHNLRGTFRQPHVS